MEETGVVEVDLVLVDVAAVELAILGRVGVEGAVMPVPTTSSGSRMGKIWV